VKVINYEEFQILSQKNAKYYAGRWKLFEAAGRLIGEIAPRSCLELGAGFFTVAHGADVMDLQEKMYYGLPDGEGRNIHIHNAEDVPWDFIPDKRYDLFVALQVFEHLKRDKVGGAFAEAKRVARNVIISLPHKWDVPSNMLMYPSHHMIDVATVASWTDGILPEPSLTELVPRTGDKISLGEKMIYVWKERDIDNFARPFVSDATRGGGT
jgi:hypothetical protein